MAGVALHNSSITDTTKIEYVKYRIYRLVPYDPGNPDAIPPISPTLEHWAYVNTDYRDAKITGKVSVSSSKLIISGNYVAVIDDKTIENWEASPPVPENTDQYQYEVDSSTPASGNGQGKITSGSSKLFLGGKAVALVGSAVKTCLNTMTTIHSGNSKFNVAG